MPRPVRGAGAPREPAGGRVRGALPRSPSCRGGELSEAFEAFERALAEHDGLSVPFERGPTLLSLGTVRRQAQQKKAAREALEQAQATFEELGARLWAEKARAELKRISGRTPASEELTETERRVAELAARGRTNKAIATELFMGASTVESHLSRSTASSASGAPSSARGLPPWKKRPKSSALRDRCPATTRPVRNHTAAVLSGPASRSPCQNLRAQSAT
jgi:DNA-binding CsgD family transcriptional regulator